MVPKSRSFKPRSMKTIIASRLLISPFQCNKEATCKKVIFQEAKIVERLDMPETSITFLSKFANLEFCYYFTGIAV